MAPSGELLEDAFQAITSPISIYRAHRNPEGEAVDFEVKFMNDAARKKHRLSEKPCGKMLYKELLPEYDSRLRAAQSEVLKTGRAMSVEVAPEAQGEVYRINISRCNDGVVLHWEDITKDRELSRRVIFEAARDDLTGLMGSTYFYNQLEKATSEARRYGAHCSVVVIDLDDFKKINDRFGHLYGNEVLRKTAAAIRQRVRDSDTSGRFGGDEFTVLLRQADAREARAITGEITKSIKRIGNSKLAPRISASAGICFVDRFSALSASQALNGADQALLQAKRGGKNSIVLFDK